MLRRRGYICEATYNIQDDVDFLYNKSSFFKIVSEVSKFRSGKMDSTQLAHKLDAIQGKRYSFFKSSDLPSQQAKEADLKNPVKIGIGCGDKGSAYAPSASEIYMTVNRNALDLLISQGMNSRQTPVEVGKAVAYLNGIDRVKNFWAEFSEASLKGTIAHELSHWLDDTLHNGHLAKKLARAKNIRDSIITAKENGIEKGDLKSMRMDLVKAISGGLPDVNLSEMEIEAQINAIKAVKATIGDKEYDSLEWEDLFDVKPSLNSNFRNLKAGKNYDDHMKRFILRLHREGLLTDKLKNYPDYSEMKRMVTKRA